MILPACFSCNNSFSENEKYFICFIDYLKSIVFNNYSIKEKTIKLFNKYPYIKKKIEDEIKVFKKYIDFRYDKEAIESILLKIGKGHMAYEFSEPFLGTPKVFNYDFIFNLSSKELEKFNKPIISDITPEIGSRQFEQLYLSNDGDILYLWKIIKENEYRYLTYISSDHIGVRFIVSEFLLCEILWD